MDNLRLSTNYKQMMHTFSLQQIFINFFSLLFTTRTDVLSKELHAVLLLVLSTWGYENVM
jgi:hypothetical protein